MVGHRVMSRASAVLLVGALASLVACSSKPDRLDRAATERAIEQVIETELPQTVEEVTCPERIPRGEGETVRCEVALTGVAGSVGIDVEQVPGDELDVTLLDAVIDPMVIADQLERQLLATYLRTFTADCGLSGAQVLAPGSTVPCKVTDDGGEREATATVADASGTLRFEVADADEASLSPEPSGPPDEPEVPDDGNRPSATFGPAPDSTTVGQADGG